VRGGSCAGRKHQPVPRVVLAANEREEVDEQCEIIEEEFGALPRDYRAASAAVERKPDEGFLAWGPQEMAFAGMVVAATLFGAGLLLTIREVRLIA
jgi:hypothetical protein